MPRKKKTSSKKRVVRQAKEEKIPMLDEDIEELVEKKAEEAKQITEKKAREVEEYVRENPMQAITIAFLVGFLLGRLKK